MSIKTMKCLDKTVVDQLKQLEIESCNRQEIALKLELDYKLAYKQSENEDNEFLYYDGDRIIGYLGILAFGSTAEMTGMVHPDFRRRGLFTKLLRAVTKEMHDRRYDEVLLLADEKSHSGKRFIDHIGAIYKTSEYEMTFVSHSLANCSMLTFGKAKPQDSDAIITIDERCFGKSHGVEIEHTYTAYSGDTMVGKVRLELINGHGGIFGLCVLPEFRKNGYGKSLLENSIFELKKQGAEKIFLQVVTKNENALGLYLNTGFRIDNRMDYYQLNTRIFN